MNKKPNIIMIFSDQQHFQALGCVDPHFSTPNLDTFCNDAYRFDTVYCTTPLCSPSRASLLTGYEPPRSGVSNNGNPLHRSTIAPLLQAAGYRTAYFGKWHLKDEPIATKGWNHQHGICDEFRPPNRPLSDAETCAYACDFIDNVDDTEQPFALFVSFDEPHGIYWAKPGIYPPDHCNEPFLRNETVLPKSWHHNTYEKASINYAALCKDQPPAKYIEEMGDDEISWRRYREIYRDRVAAYDRSFGTVIDHLRRRGFIDRSFITITSDHGDMDAHHHLAFKGPIFYEQVQRVPLAMKLPEQFGGKGPKIDTRNLVSLVDVPATFCNLAGSTMPNDTNGISLMPLLTGTCNEHKRQEAFIWYPEPAIRTIRRGDWKYSMYPGYGEYLYNLSEDPCELDNRIRDPRCVTIRNELRATLNGIQ